MDSVKQSAALCLLRLYRTSPDLVPMGDWTARVVHLLNDQHLVCLTSEPDAFVYHFIIIHLCVVNALYSCTLHWKVYLPICHNYKIDV